MHSISWMNWPVSSYRKQAAERARGELGSFGRVRLWLGSTNFHTAPESASQLSKWLDFGPPVISCKLFNIRLPFITDSTRNQNSAACSDQKSVVNFLERNELDSSNSIEICDTSAVSCCSL